MSQKESKNVIENISNLENILLDIKFKLNFKINKNTGPVLDHSKYYSWSGLIASKTKTIKNLGGYNNFFFEWGGEDRDLIFRLINYNNKVTKPINLQNTVTTEKIMNYTAYEGWRSFHALVGGFLENYNLLAYHIYHPLNSDAETRLLNLEKSKQNIKFYFDKYYILQKEIADNDKKKIVVLGRNPYIVNTQLLDEFNDFYIFNDLQTDQNSSEIVFKIKNLCPQFIFIWNPFSNKIKKEVYLKLLDLNFNIYAVERGGLPNTYYFDNTGFSLSSKLYEEKNWVDKRLNNSQLKFILRYKNKLLNEIEPLEKQSNDLKLLDNLKYKKNKIKYLLVLFQLENDTATNHCIQDGRTYNCFLEEVNIIEKFFLLNKDWKILYKNHPLSKNKITLKDSICVDSCNINNIIKISDIVLTFNSGSGLIAMICRIPVFYFGKCYYAIENVNFKYITIDDFFNKINKINRINKVNYIKVLKFINYLINDFYSNCITTFYAIKNKKKVNRCYYTKIYIPGLIDKRYEHLNDIDKSIIFNKYIPSLKIKYIPSLNNENFISRFKKKFKKLFRNPILFFCDAKIFK
jgi:hypothetical protein